MKKSVGHLTRFLAVLAWSANLLLAAATPELAVQPPAHHDYDMQHLSLEIHPNFAERSLQVVEHLSIRAVDAHLRSVWLDSDGPQIDTIQDSQGQALRFEQKPAQLVIELTRELQPGESDTVEIRYHVTPHGGLAFVAADIAHPNVATSLWAAGEPDSNHYWLPIYDHPDDKLTADFTVVAPPGDWAIANGRLAGTRRLSDGSTEIRWTQEEPISSYLLTVYVSHWTRVPAEWRHDGARVPVEYDVPPDESPELAQVVYGRTPAMMDYFTSLTGVPYPWAKYNQVENPGFFAGLENASATEFPGDYPDNGNRANFEFQARGGHVGLAHELAHQWFGDLVTCRDWSDLWLNEGFATFMQYVWDERANGRDRALEDLEDSASGYIDMERFGNRAIVPSKYDSPWDMFDVTTYNKGGWALRVLEGQLGEAAFWKAIHAYLTEYRAQPADTEDFERVVEQSTGRDLHEFYQQWFRTPGHPEFSTSWRWDETKKAAVIRLEQTQARKPNHALYTGNITIAAWVKGRRTAKSFALRSERETFELPLPARPQLVQVDPEHEWLKEVTREKRIREWTYEAGHAPYSVDRIRALQTLLKLSPRQSPRSARFHFGRVRGEPESLSQAQLVKLLAGRVRHDAQLSTRSFALEQLARMDASKARPMALAWLKSPDAGTRLAGLRAVMHLPEKTLQPSDLARVRHAFETDAIGQVRTVALEALLKFDPEHKSQDLDAALKMRTFDWSVECRALEAWAGLGAKALPVLKVWAAPSVPPAPREAAVHGLGKVGQGDPEALRLLREALATAPPYNVQMAAATALADLNDQASLPEIQHLRDQTWVGFFRGEFADAATKLENAKASASRGNSNQGNR